MHTSTWRVGDDDIRTAMLPDEIVGQDILHIACIEEGVLDVVYLRIHLCILDGFRHVFDTDYFFSLVCHEIGNGSGTGVEVVNQLVSCEVGKFTRHTVEVVSLLGIGLIETLRTYLELQVFHQFKDMVVALEKTQFQIIEGIVALLVVYIHERCNLRESVSYLLHQFLRSLLVAFFVVMELEHKHPFACVGVANHHVSQQSMLLTQIVESIVVRIGILEYEVANLIAEVVHQPAFLDRIYLVEGSGDMKTDGILCVAFL
ncbi:unknown [Prevotella sp. CAG:604]|nr:unknown [Prevotella sp. CAG:604]